MDIAKIAYDAFMACRNRQGYYGYASWDSATKEQKEAWAYAIKVAIEAYESVQEDIQGFVVS